MTNHDNGPVRHRRPVVRSAGIVVLWRTAGHVKVLIVHRPKYNDWVLPKGHVEPGELIPETACREFREETGYRAAITMPISVVDYPIDAAIKRVHWFVGRLVSPEAGSVHNPHEVDGVAWKRLDKALALLTYENEKDVVRQAAGLPNTRQLLIVRHAKALGRKGWKKDDWLRPLAARGRRQAEQLTQLLSSYAVGDLASSSSTRCLETLQPYAGKAQVPIEQIDALSEEGAMCDPAGVGKTMAGLRGRLLKTGVPVAVCSHRPVLPAMIDELGIDAQYSVMRPGEVLVAHLDAATGHLVATQRYPSKL
ncbi:MAG: NUDIX hydrolase [Propionibacteriaceae bacterium]|nr:NUDIX hydrolase [Propionibacteriaceae bacterium]